MVVMNPATLRMIEMHRMNACLDNSGFIISLDEFSQLRVNCSYQRDVAFDNGMSEWNQTYHCIWCKAGTYRNASS